jgi:hypothetical protein
MQWEKDRSKYDSFKRRNRVTACKCVLSQSNHEPYVLLVTNQRALQMGKAPGCWLRQLRPVHFWGEAIP